MLYIFWPDLLHSGLYSTSGNVGDFKTLGLLLHFLSAKSYAFSKTLPLHD